MCGEAPQLALKVGRVLLHGLGPLALHGNEEVQEFRGSSVTASNLKTESKRGSESRSLAFRDHSRARPSPRLRKRPMLCT